MSVRVALAALFAERAGGQHRMELEGATAGQVLAALTARHAALAPLIWAEDGGLNPMLVVFRNDEDIRTLNGLETPLAPGDELTVVSALEGG